MRRVVRMDWFYQRLILDPNDDVVHEEILNALTLQTTDYQSLKVLRFTFFKMSGRIVEFFLRNCCFLERLVLENLTLTSDLHLVGGSLKHLDIRSRSVEYSIKICAPNLIWLTIDNGSSRVFLENVPKLVNMHFFCRHGDTMHDFAKVAPQLETLIITLYHPTELFSVPEMPKLNKLVVYYCYVHENIRIPITCLIQASPCLEEFKLDISDIIVRERVFEIPEDGPSPTLWHRHLKRVVLSGSYRANNDELMKYILTLRKPLLRFKEKDNRLEEKKQRI